MCPNDGRQTKPGHWMCENCEHDYHALVLQLGGDMMALTSIAMKLARIGPMEHTPNTGVAPLPIDTHAADLLGQAREWMRAIATRLDPRNRHTGRKWLHGQLLDHWDTIVAMHQAPDDYQALRDLKTRIDWTLTPREVGTTNTDCPQCHAQLAYPPQAQWADCPKCGTRLDLTALHQAREAEMQAKTFPATCAGAARWATEQTAVKVTGMDIKNWIRRGKLHPMKCADGKTWRWIARELKDVTVEIATRRAQMKLNGGDTE